MTPGRGRQIERLGPRFQTLQEALEARRARIQNMPEGTVPEMVLVIELSAPVDSFKGALKRAGLEWLDEIEAEDTEPDDDFFVVDRNGERSDKTYSAGCT